MTIERIAKYGFDAIHVPEGESRESFIFKLAEAQKKIKAVALKFYDTWTETKGDVDLTGEGKAKKMRQLALSAIEQLDKLRTEYLAPAEQHLSELQGKFKLSVDRTNEIGDVLREQEARALLRELDSAKRYVIFSKAVAEGDTVTVRAFLLGPAWEPLLNEQILEQGRRDWTMRLNPILAGALVNMHEAIATVSLNFRETYESITQVGKVDDEAAKRIRTLAARALNEAQARYEYQRLQDGLADAQGNPLPAPAATVITGGGR
jgi:hypothetical protein